MLEEGRVTVAIIVSGGRRRGGRHGWKKRRRTARRERKTGVERKNERERPVMAAMMTVSGCVYRLSRSVPARRPSRVNLNHSVFDPLLYSSIARAIQLPVLLVRSYPSICCRTRARASFLAPSKLEFLNGPPDSTSFENETDYLFTYLLI